MQPTPAGAGRPHRRRILPVVGAVVVAVAIVVALAAAGVLSFGSKPSSSPPADETFAEASAVATSASGSVAGGPWYGVLGAALVTPFAVLEPAANLTAVLSFLNCTSHWISGEPSNVAIPATPASAALGTAAFWSFVLKNATNVLLLETVAQGSASALVTLNGSTCSEGAGYLDSFGGGMQDSPKIVAAANAAGGSAFLATYPNATEFWGVSGGVTYGVLTTSPEWFLEYTSCSLPAGANEEGAVFNATVGGTSATVTNHTSGEADCALTGASLPSLARPSGPPPVSAGKAI